MTKKSKVFLGLILFLLATPVYAGWDTEISKDEMTGKKLSYASSSTVVATKRMESPYTNTKAWIGVGCDGTKEWAYIGFTNQPNLNNTETKDGYSQITTRIKWDKMVEEIDLTQDWGSKFLHFQDDDSVISNIVKSSSILLELDWYGEGKVYFKFSLSGSAAALKQIRNECAKSGVLQLPHTVQFWEP